MNRESNTNYKKPNNQITNQNNTNSGKVGGLVIKKNGKDYIPNSAVASFNNEYKKSPSGSDILSKIIPKRQEPKIDSEKPQILTNQQQSKSVSIAPKVEQKQNTESQQKTQPLSTDATNTKRELIKKVQSESKGLIRRTSSSIDEKQRNEIQTPTMTAQKNPLIPAAAASGAIANDKMPEIKLNFYGNQNQPAILNKEVKQKLITQVPALGAGCPANIAKPTLNFKALLSVQQQHIPQTSQETQKIEQPKQVKTIPINQDQNNQTKNPQFINSSNNQPDNQQQNQKISPVKNNLLMNNANLISSKINIQKVEQNQLPVSLAQIIQKQVNPLQQATETQVSACNSDLSGKRSSSSLNDNSDNEFKESTIKKIKPSTENNQLEYQNLKKDVIKEMEVEDDSKDDDSSSSVSSHATVIIQDINRNSISQPTSQQQYQEDFSRKGSDVSDDSQKSLSSPVTLSSCQQENIQISLQKQRKKSQQIELNGKIRQNLQVIDSKREKILKISQLIQEQLSPEMMKILKEQVQRQKELLYQNHSTSSKKQNKINSKLLNTILQNNVQFLQDLKI